MMPRVIQPGGGGGKICVQHTARRKRGLVAALKRMQAEVIRWENCVLLHLPPAEKIIQNPLRKVPRHPPGVSAQTPLSYV